MPIRTSPLGVTNAAGPGLSILATDTARMEGNSGLTTFTVTVTRSGGTTGVAGIGWKVAGSGAGNDRLDGGVGNHTFTGGTGKDLFHFGPSPTGRDLITDFHDAEGDVLEWTANPIRGVNTFNTLRSHMTDVADGVFASFGKSSTGEGVTLEGVHKAEPAAADFIFP